MFRRLYLWVYDPERFFARDIRGKEVFWLFIAGIALQVLVAGVHNPMGLPDYVLKVFGAVISVLLIFLIVFPISHLIASYLGEDEPPLSEGFKYVLSLYGLSWLVSFPVSFGLSFLHPVFSLLSYVLFAYLLVKYFMWAYQVSVAGALLAVSLPPLVILVYMVVMAYHIWILKWTLFS